MDDIVVVYRDWRKRVMHNVVNYRLENGYFFIQCKDEVYNVVIPADFVSYIGPPEPWENGGCF